MSKVIMGIKMLTYGDVQEMLGVSRVALLKYINEGGLQCRTIGARRYIAEDNLREFLLSSDAKKNPEASKAHLFD